MHRTPVVILRCLLTILLATAVLVALTSACRSGVREESKNVVVNAPADGIVRRVVVNPDGAVDKDEAIIEIAVQPQHPTVSDSARTNATEAQVARAKTDLASAESEANRALAEVRPIERLVKRGLASQAELDKARSQSLDAQERLRVAREKAKNAETRHDQASAIAANEEIIVVRAPAAGTVQAVSVHAGQAVVMGQPLVTLVSNS
jgi:multidrug resistance efflux pump